MNEERLGIFNIIIFILSIYVLLAVFADTFFKLPAEISRLLNIIDYTICFIFLLDFLYRFKKSKNKLNFMKWGWIDLLSSIPMIDFFRFGRIIRVIRIFRIIKAFKTLKMFVEYVFKNKVSGTFSSVSVIAILVIIFSSISILQVENAPDSNIKTAEDAIWWSYVTVTTVGYGEYYPVTTAGRIIAGILMTVGVGLFGTFTAYVASWFVDDKQKI
jgi:voltage-gated potassium channel